MKTTIVPRCISLNRLKKFLGDDKVARDVRRAMREGYEVPSGHHPSHAAFDYVFTIFALIPDGDFHSVESLYPRRPELYYLNVGDPYVNTLVYDYKTAAWSIRAWGDLVE